MDTNTKNSGNQSVLTELFEKNEKGDVFIVHSVYSQ